MKQAILNSLKEISEKQEIQILFACESGSRAWGFSSPDSDYDVRFIYVHKLDHYLALDSQKDTIDLMLPGDLDLGGWDLRKTLKLFAGSNIALFEWLGSPIKYDENVTFHQELIGLIPDFFNPKKAVHHYLSLARNGMQKWDETHSVKLKTLFYVLRALACAEFIHSKQKMPSTVLREVLLQIGIPDVISEALEAWWALKESSTEAEKIGLSRAQVESIQGWWDRLHETAEQLSTHSGDMRLLNELFIRMVKQTAK